MPPDRSIATSQVSSPPTRDDRQSGRQSTRSSTLREEALTEKRQAATSWARAELLVDPLFLAPQQPSRRGDHISSGMGLNRQVCVHSPARNGSDPHHVPPAEDANPLRNYFHLVSRRRLPTPAAEPSKRVIVMLSRPAKCL